MVKQQQSSALVGFRDYFEELETRLGAVLIPVEHDATGPRQIVSTEALHVDLAREAAVEIYKKNQCRGIHSPVHLFPTLDALGNLRFKAERANTTDRALVEFLELLGEATLLILSDQSTRDSESNPNYSK